MTPFSAIASAYSSSANGPAAAFSNFTPGNAVPARSTAAGTNGFSRDGFHSAGCGTTGSSAEPQIASTSSATAAVRAA